jgi:teichuronic acid exporter
MPDQIETVKVEVESQIDEVALAKERQRLLDRSLSHGIFWMGGVKWFAQLLAWVSTFFVARILQPADYGLVGLATTFLAIVTLLGEFGIGTAVVMRRELGERELGQMNTIAMLFGFASFITCAAAAPLLAAFFRAPELASVVVVMGTVFVITGFRIVPQAVLQRELRFKDLAMNEGVNVTVVAVGSVCFALLGFRYWTLVISALLAALLSTLLALRLRRVSWRRPVWHDVKEAVEFSRQTVVSRLAWTVYSNADYMIAGRMLGREPLGAYSFGRNLANAPPERITNLISGVTPSILSSVQRDAAALRRYLLVISEALAMATLPAALGLALVANDLVPAALGSKWQSMVAPLQLLAIAAGIRAVTPLFPQILTAVGRNRLTMRLNIVGALLMPFAFWFGSHWGTIGVAAVWLFVYPVILVIPVARTAFRAIELEPSTYFRALRPALVSGAAMVVAVLAIELLRPVFDGRTALLFLKVAVGAVAYLMTLWFGYRSRVLTFVNAARGVRA